MGFTTEDRCHTDQSCQSILLFGYILYKIMILLSFPTFSLFVLHLKYYIWKADSNSSPQTRLHLQGDRAYGNPTCAIVSIVVSVSYWGPSVGSTRWQGISKITRIKMYHSFSRT